MAIQTRLLQEEAIEENVVEVQQLQDAVILNVAIWEVAIVSEVKQIQ